MFDGEEEFLLGFKISKTTCIHCPWLGVAMAFKLVTFRQHSFVHSPHHEVALENGHGTFAIDDVLRMSWMPANIPGFVILILIPLEED